MLKRHLAAQHAEDRGADTAGKEAFIPRALAAVGNRAGADATTEPLSQG